MTAWVMVFNRPLAYAAGVRLQETLVSARLADRIPDTLLLLEHHPVITLGVRANAKHVLLSPEALARRGIERVQSSRGGDVTWHGPGQLVLYPIIRLGKGEADAHGFLHNLEDVAIRTAAHCGVGAFRRPGLTGAWTAGGKLAAIGIRLKRWVTFHGMSFNVNPDLSGFSAIIPCGLEGEPVTSLQALLGNTCPTIKLVRERLLKNFSAICNRDLSIVPSENPSVPDSACGKEDPPAELIRLLGNCLRQKHIFPDQEGSR